MKLLENKTAIITGAARGIGEAIAIKFIAFMSLRLNVTPKVRSTKSMNLVVKYQF